MSEREELYVTALAGKKIPILTLDHKWHQLFTQVEPNPLLKEKEAELNELLKQQGKMNTEIKDIKKIKTRLMDEIVSLMDNPDKKTDAKIEENKRLIEECNEKMDEYKDSLMDLPAQISKANKELMLLTMEVCYETFKDNEEKLEEITAWINQVRIDLKKNMVRKTEMQKKNQDLYAYMHDIFGANVIELFDMKYKQEHEIKE